MMPSLLKFVPTQADSRAEESETFNIGAVWQPWWFAHAGALAFGLSCLLLWRNLLSAYRMYRRLITAGA